MTFRSAGCSGVLRLTIFKRFSVQFSSLLAQTMAHTLGAVQEELALRLGLYAQVAERPTPRLGLGIGSGLVLGLGVR